MSRKWLCTNCGHTEEGHEGVNLYMAKWIECPKCHKWTLIPVNKFPVGTIEEENDSLAQPSALKTVDSFASDRAIWNIKLILTA